MSPRINQTGSGSGKTRNNQRQTPGRPSPPPSKTGASEALGLLELTSIAKGIEATDLMLKAAQVELMVSRSICSGKYLVLVRGDVAACSASVAAGENCGREAVADSVVIPNLHGEIFPAIAQSVEVDEVKALGILEAYDVTGLIEGADAAVKAAGVHLIEIRIAMALGGKAFCILTGEVAAVKAAVEAGKYSIGEKGLLTNWSVIPAPSERLVKELLGGRLA